PLEQLPQPVRDQTLSQQHAIRLPASPIEMISKARMPERSLMGILARTAYWVEWWRRFGRPPATSRS
ncbi:hypothetical protein, partial [Streptomyces sp. NPDC059916]|uniref:hypothetical protein n=1 Tax=Streptomyces sp. NPDC059916 TaxID=3347001 RepID=UPI00369AE8CF